MATKTTWWDKNNDQHEGYIIDGKTYMDEAGTTRVPVGATVNTAGGTFKMTANGGVPTYSTAKTQYQTAAQAAINAYKAQSGAQEQSIRMSTEAAVKELERQKKLAKQNREQANREAYTAYLMASNPYGAAEEQRARIGLADSGYSETSKMKLASAYTGQLSENMRAMNEQLQELDVQIAQAKANGQYELATVLEARAQNILQQEIALQNNLFSGDMQAWGQAESTRQFDEQMAENTRQFEAQMAAQKAQAEQQNKWDLAIAFIENGKNASFIAETLGIPQSDVNTLIAAVNAQKTVRSSSGGSSSRSTKTEKSDAYETVVYAARKKEDAEEALEYLENMVEAGKISEAEALDIFEVELGYNLSELQKRREEEQAAKREEWNEKINKITGTKTAKSVH